MQKTAEYNVLIAGTGAAGLCCALNCLGDAGAPAHEGAGGESDSFLAQGGICMLRGKEDFRLL